MNPIHWPQSGKMRSHSYACGFCGSALASEEGWVGERSEHRGIGRGAIYVCHQCTRPTFFDEGGQQYPGISHGESVKNVTDTALNQIYEEARRAISASCFTAAVLCCRKLLMHLAVAKGAKAGDTFKNYVEFLASGNHVPAACKSWVEQIRDAGNEANHEIVMMKPEDAKDLVSFCHMLLKITYEFPAVALARSAAKAKT